MATVDPGGYAPDPPLTFTFNYLCPACGARYETFVAVEELGGCRNRGCDARPRRYRRPWGPEA